MIVEDEHGLTGIDTVNGRFRAYCVGHQWFGPWRLTRWDAVGDQLEHDDEAEQ